MEVLFFFLPTFSTSSLTADLETAVRYLWRTASLCLSLTALRADPAAPDTSWLCSDTMVSKHWDSCQLLGCSDQVQLDIKLEELGLPAGTAAGVGQLPVLSQLRLVSSQLPLVQLLPDWSVSGRTEKT